MDGHNSLRTELDCIGILHFLLANKKIHGLLMFIQFQWVGYSQIAKFAMRGEDVLRALLDVSAENI